MAFDFQFSLVNSLFPFIFPSKVIMHCFAKSLPLILFNTHDFWILNGQGPHQTTIEKIRGEAETREGDTLP